MVVLDTDVVSALTRPRENPRATKWVFDHTDDLFITSTTISEMVFGVMIMPEGRRKSETDDAVMKVLSGFYDRTIDFGGSAAIEHGRFVCDRKAAGRPIGRADAQIAACCIAVGAELATRNTKDFEGIPGLKLINPWEYEPAS
ncbi:MAG: type II toxin-antitoxin system VapC family toxin [Solirubrobacterales bacterium]